MIKRFTVYHLAVVDAFLSTLEPKCAEALDAQIEASERLDLPLKRDSLKKLIGTDLYEYRRTCNGLAIRILCFYDKTDKDDTRLVSCHGFIKTTQKTPKKEIAIATRRRDEYFE